MDSILRASKDEAGIDLATRYLSRILRIFYAVFIPIYLFRAYLAYDQGSLTALVLHLSFASALLLAQWRMRGSRDYRSSALFVANAMLFVETALLAMGLTHLSQFLFVLPMGIVFVTLLVGMGSGLLFAILSTALGLFFLHTTPSRELIYSIALVHESFGRDFYFYMVASQLMIAVVIFYFQDFLMASAQEIKRHRLERSKASRRSAFAETAGKLAHEVNNPLAIMDGSCRILRKNLWREDLDEQNRKLLFMEEALLRLRNVVESAQYYSAGDQSGEGVWTTVASILQQLGSQVDERIRTFGGSLVVQNHCFDDRILCYPERILFVLSVLIDNALEASRGAQKPIHLRVRILREKIRWELTDEGRGIADDISELIFTPFFTTKSIGQSMGLNLSLSRVIVEELGGSIGFEKQALGTSFWFELPAHRR